MEDRKTMRSKIMFVRKTLQIVMFVLSLGTLITTTHLGGQVVGFFEGDEWHSQMDAKSKYKLELVVDVIDPTRTIGAMTSQSIGISVFLLFIFLISQLKKRKVFGVLNLLLLMWTIYWYYWVIDLKQSFVESWSPYNDWLIIILQINWLCYVAVITMFFTELTIVLMNCIYRENPSLPYS